MTGYDKYCESEDLFGEPYPDLIDFTRQYEPKGKMIDLVEIRFPWQDTVRLILQITVILKTF